MIKHCFNSNLTTKNKIHQEIINLSQTPSSGLGGSKTIVDSEQKRMLITQNYR